MKQNKIPTVLNFNLHQPLRLSPERESFLWDEKNKVQFKEATNAFYMPTLDTLAQAVATFPDFKFNLGMSGTFLEQAKEFSPELFSLLKDVISYGHSNEQIEVLGETYYNSLAEFFKNPSEFNQQVAKQKEFIKNEFGITPTTFRHTKRAFNNFIAKQLHETGFKTILSDIPNEEYNQTAYKIDSLDDMLVLKRNVPMSHLLSRNKAGNPVEYISRLEESTTPVLLSYALGRVGDASFIPFWKEFANTSRDKLDLQLAKSLYAQEEIAKLPSISIETPHSISHLRDWTEAKTITNGLIDNKTEFELFKQIESLFEFTKPATIEEERRQRSILTSYSNFRFLDSKDDSPDIRSNPYENPIDATFQFTRKVDDLEQRLKKSTAKFEILRRREKDIILTASPELSEISESIAPNGTVPVNAFGGMAIVASSMANYLAEQGFDSRILTLDMTQNYDKKAQDQYRQKVAADMKVHEDKVYLVRSFAFDNIKNPYNEVPKEFLASESQNYAMKYVFPKLLKENRNIIHMYHDQVFGGVSAGKFKHIADTLKHKGDQRLLKNIQYSHNVHSTRIGMDNFKDLPHDVRSQYLYYTDGKADSLLTGIKNADGTFFVSERWLYEVLQRHFPDRVPEAFAREIEIQNNFGKVKPILNGLPKDRYPEFAESLKYPELYFPKASKEIHSLINPFGPDNDVLEAKKRNKLAFQKLVGLKENPDAILAVYSGRFDFYQKQCDILEHIIPHLQIELGKQNIAMQFAYISNPVNEPNILTSYAGIGAQAINSNGMISVSPFSLPLELLGNAGADVANGVSITEMCGLNDELALIHGALPAFTRTGGLIDKIKPYSVAGFKGATHTEGNGVLFGSSHDDIWNGLKHSFELQDYLQTRPELNRQLIYNRMVDARNDLSIEKQGNKLVSAIGDVLGRPLR